MKNLHPPSSAAKKKNAAKKKKTRVRETCNQIFSEKNSPRKPRFCSQRFTLDWKIKGSRGDDDDDVYLSVVETTTGLILRMKGEEREKRQVSSFMIPSKKKSIFWEIILFVRSVVMQQKL